MKPPPFDYLRADTVPAALAALDGGAREAKVIAGGPSLLPVLNMRMAHPDLLVDITRVPELGVLEVRGGTLHVGAAVTQARVGADPAVRRGWPLLTAAIGHIGHPQIRHRGTLCGSLAHNDPSAELPAAAVALDATVVLDGPRGERRIPAADFFLGTFACALEPGEMVVRAELPVAAPGSGWGFREHAQRRGDFATVGVAVVLGAAPHVVAFGVADGPIRLEGVEAALVGGAASAEEAQIAVASAAAALDPPDDIHATARFRRELTAELTRVAIADAWGRIA